MSTRERIQSPFGTQAPASARPPGPAPPAASGEAPAGERGATARLALRALTGWEEEYLERHAQEPNTARLCNEVLARCLVAPGEDPAGAREAVRTLLVAERDRELVALRRMSLGPQIGARVSCPQCGEESEVEFSLDVLPLDFERPAEPVRVELQDAGDAVLRLPTAGDQEDLAATALEGDAERRTWLIARCLQRYGERSDGLDLDFARGLPVGLRRELEAAIEARLPDLDLEMAVECSHCQARVVAPFDVPSFFFRVERACEGAAARRPRARARVRLDRARRVRAATRAPLRVPPAARGGGPRRAARRLAHGRAGMSAGAAR